MEKFLLLYLEKRIKVGNKKIKSDKIVSLDEVLDLILDISPQKRPRSKKRLKNT